MKDLLNYDISEGLYWLLPELIIAGIILVMTLMIILPGSSERLLKGIAFFGFFLVAAASVYQYVQIETQHIDQILGTGYVNISRFAIFWKILLSLSMAVVSSFPLSFGLKKVRGEYYVLLATALLGAFFLVMTRHLLMLVLSLELLSLSSYLLAGISRSKGAIEASLKYFLFGAAATAVMIYGISWFYGITGHLSLQEATLEDLWNADGPEWMPVFVIVLISSGILFKVSVIPWHLWVLDVYEQVPVPVISMFSVVPKLAGFAFLSFWTTWLDGPVEVLAILAVVTMSVGNFAALKQKDVKRMMAYSSIAHSGFLLMALLRPGDMSALMFYATVYAGANLGSFMFINYFERHYKLSGFEDYDGLFRLFPAASIFLVIFMIALTGLPPTAGFTAKLFLFSQVASGYQETGVSVLLFTMIFGLINTVVALAYYVRLPYRLIFRKMSSSVIVPKKYSRTENFLYVILVLGVLIFFFKPEWLMGWINNSSFAF